MRELVHECFLGIYEMKLTQANNEMNIFFIAGKENERSLMIDTGYRTAENQQLLERLLTSLHVSYENLDIFLTHKHHDHIGLAEYFSNRGATIYMNPVEDRHVYDCLSYNHNPKSVEEQLHVLHKAGINEMRTPELWQFLMRMTSYQRSTHKDGVFQTSAFPYKPIEIGQIFSYGAYTFEVISLSGHTMGQVGLYEPKHKLLFTGDQIIVGIVPIVGTSYIDEHLLQHYFASLETIQMQYADCTILPAHNEILTNATPVITHIVSSYRKKLSAMEQILANSKKSMTIQEMAFEAYGLAKTPLDAKHHFMIKMILTKTFSCLEYLCDIGFCKRTEEDGVLCYQYIPSSKT